MSNVDTAQEAYAAFNRGDLDSLRGMLGENAVWVTSDEVEGGGQNNGPDDIIAAFQDIPNNWSSFEVKPEEYIDGGEWVTVRGTQVFGTAKGKDTAPYCHLIKFGDNKIVRAEFFGDTAKMNALR